MPLIARWIVLVVALLAPLAAEAGAKREWTPQERMERGDRFANNGNYTRALEEYNHVRNYNRDDPVSLEAELAIADLYFKKGDFEQAKLQYEDFARLHPRNAQLDWVVFRTGLCLFKRAPGIAGRDQTPTRQAVNTWTGFAERFADSEHKEEVAEMVGKARGRLARKEIQIARFYAKRDAWVAVRRRTEGMATKYPDAPAVPEALAMAAIAYHKTGDAEGAVRARERLVAAAPESHWVERVDRELATPLGTPPEDVVFVRPYRVSGGGPAAGGGGAPQ